MPKGRSVTSKKAKPKRKVSKRRGGGAARSGMSGAPVAVSDFLQQSVRFTSTNGGRNLIMSVTAPLCLIGSDNGVSLAALFPRSSATTLGTTNYYQATFNPIQGRGYQVAAASEQPCYWINPIWSLMADCFVRYRILKLKFIYQPQSSATIDDQLVFAFAADPYHPIIGPSAGVVSNANLLSVADSMPFMPWHEWEIDVTEAFCNDAPSYCRPVPTGDVASANRLSSVGVFACTSNSLDATPRTYGVLYGNISIEFQEFCPQVISEVIPSMLSRATQKLPAPSERLIDEVTAEVRRRICGDRTAIDDISQSHGKEKEKPQFAFPGSMEVEVPAPRNSGAVFTDPERIVCGGFSPEPTLYKMKYPDGEISFLLGSVSGQKEIHILDRSEAIKGIRLVEVFRCLGKRFDLPLKSIHLGDSKYLSDGEIHPSDPTD